MFKVHCRNCGALQGEGVTVGKLREGNDSPKRNETLGDQLVTEFRCNSCDTVERIEEGVLPELEAKHFDSIWVGDGDTATPVVIDGEAISYESVDEQIAENSHYTPEGVRGNSKVHHLHIHAVNPPSFSKGRHTVKIGDFVDEEFILSEIRYHDSTRRTLKFYRSIPNELPEPIGISSPSLTESESSR